MPSLLVLIFLVELAVNLVNTVGATTINNLLWTLLNYLPLETSKAATEDRKLRHEVVKVRRDLNATSSQDEFAKWAKLRRTHDKLLEQLEKNKQTIDASRSKFDTYLTGFRWLVTRVPQYLLPFWYGKQPMFWLPYGWFPYYAEWILSFPRAPMGSVSIVSWQLACTGMIALWSELITSVLGLAFASGKGKEGPTTVPGTPAAPSKEKKRAKKEL